MGQEQRETVGDLLKGTAVVLMVQVHVFELLARPAVLESWVGRVSLLLGGPPAAPVFMAAMGYFAGRSTRSCGSFLLRGVKLIGLGFALNLGLNAHLLWNISRGTLPLDPWRYVFGVDILFLAGLSLMMIGLLRPVLGRHPQPWLLTALAVVLLTPSATATLTTDGLLKWAYAYIAGNYPWSYFPVFPWMAYALLGVGVCFGRERHVEDAPARSLPEQTWSAHGLALALPAAILAITVPSMISITGDLPVYYHHGAWTFAWIVVFLVFWVRVHVLADRYLGHTLPGRWLRWMGRNVTAVYVFQWLIIGNTATVLYKTQSLTGCCLWLAGVLAASNLLTGALVYARSRLRDSARDRQSRHAAMKPST